jgi:transcription antitermination factor NusG
MNSINVDFKDWFVLQVRTTREYFIKSFIEKHTDEDITIVVFSRELIFKRRNREFKCLSPLFPGYLFVHKKVEKALITAKKNYLHEFIKPLCFKENEKKCKICFSELAPCHVLESEIEFLFRHADETGKISLSYGVEKESAIQFINGPLKYLHPHILWINKKKKKACVEIELFKSKMQVNLGFNLLT